MIGPTHRIVAGHYRLPCGHDASAGISRAGFRIWLRDSAERRAGAQPIPRGEVSLGFQRRWFRDDHRPGLRNPRQRQTPGWWPGGNAEQYCMLLEQRKAGRAHYYFALRKDDLPLFASISGHIYPVYTIQSGVCVVCPHVAVNGHSDTIEFRASRDERVPSFPQQYASPVAHTHTINAGVHRVGREFGEMAVVRGSRRGRPGQFGLGQ